MLLSLVNDLLDLYQIKKGKFTKRVKEIKITDFIDNIKSLIEIQMRNKNLTLLINMDEDEMPSTLKFDADRIT